MITATLKIRRILNYLKKKKNQQNLTLIIKQYIFTLLFKLSCVNVTMNLKNFFCINLVKLSNYQMNYIQDHLPKTINLLLFVVGCCFHFFFIFQSASGLVGTCIFPSSMLYRYPGQLHSGLHLVSKCKKRFNIKQVFLPLLP